MGETRTFVDSSVLISAARGTDEIAGEAFAVLDDPARTFVTTDFVRLEVLPKCMYFGHAKEAEFYQEFFKSATCIVPISDDLVSEAFSEATNAGLSAVDALHVAAAKEAQADEFVTGEKPTRDLFRLSGLKLTSLRALR